MPPDSVALANDAAYRVEGHVTMDLHVLTDPGRLPASRPGVTRGIAPESTCAPVLQRFQALAVSRTTPDFQATGARPDEPNLMLDQQLDAGAPPQDVGGEPRDASLPGGVTTPPAAVPAQSSSGTPLLSAVSVSFARVRAASTPAGMAPDRVPPRVDTPVRVDVTGWGPPMAFIEIGVEGSGGVAGSATVDGRATTQVGSSGNITLRGTTQTTPGNAGRLRLVATLGTDVVGRSNAFSVAAIPQNMRLVSNTAVTGASRGFAVAQAWDSDSGSVADLDEVQVSEQVETVSTSGIFTGLGGATSGYIAASSGTLTDTHGTPTAALTGPGTRRANQTEMFLDNRTAVRDIPMRASGFIIDRGVFNMPGVPFGPPPGLYIRTAKAGASVTANGIASSAGAGSMSITQRV